MLDDKDIIAEVVVDPPTSINFTPPAVQVLPAVPAPNSDDADLDKDFKKAQQSIQESMDLANDAVKDLAQMAKDTNHPKIYEVLSALLRTVAQNARDLIEVHKRVKEIKLASELPTQITNNNLILTTAEVIEAIKKKKENLPEE